jgi:hypothetical protein
MTDLRDRFGELDQLSVPDLRTAIRGRHPSKAVRVSSMRRGASGLVALLVALAGLALGVRGFLRGEQEIVTPMTSSLADPEERAASVAIAALLEEGLYDPFGSSFDYLSVRAVEGRWEASFCSSYPSHQCDGATGDSFIYVAQDGDDLVIEEVTGAFREEHRAQLLGYRERAESGPPEWRWGPFFIDRLGEQKAVGSGSLWTGAIPSSLGAICTIEVLGQDGAVLVSREVASVAPEREQGRDGTFFLEIPEDTRAADGRVVCTELLPVQGQPEGERHVLASGTFESGEYQGTTWRFVVWRAAEVDDERVLALWKRNMGPDAYCWGLDAEPLNPESHGQQIVPGSCTRLSDSDHRAPFGPRSFDGGFHGAPAMAWGEVSAEVHALEFRLAGGESLSVELLDPPAELGIKSRFYMAVLPSGATGEIAALGEDGNVLATRQLGRS